MPLPAAMRRLVEASTIVPGDEVVSVGTVADEVAMRSMLRRIGSPPDRCQKVYARGQGRRPRVWFLISDAERDQSIAPCSFLRRGALEARLLSCAIDCAAPDSSLSTTSSTASAPMAARRVS